MEKRKIDLQGETTGIESKKLCSDKLSFTSGLLKYF